MNIYCIEHEEMTDAQYTPIGFGHGVNVVEDAGYPYSFMDSDFCEFPMGYAFCPPPTSLAEELDRMTGDEFAKWCADNDPENQIEVL